MAESHRSTPTDEELKLEEKKLRYLRRMVDFTLMLIISSDMTLEEAARHASGVRDFAIRLFPDKAHVFDLVYGPKFKRLINEKYMLS